MAGGGLPLVALVACRQGTGRTWSAQAMASHLRQTPSAGGGLSSRRVLVSATAWQTAQSSFAARWTRCENGCAVCATATPAIAISRKGTRNLETVESEEVKSEESEVSPATGAAGGRAVFCLLLIPDPPQLLAAIVRYQHAAIGQD